MTGRIEQATGSRSAAYPAAWGRPEGERHSEERALWVLRHVAEDRERRKIAARKNPRVALAEAAALAEAR